MSLKPRANVERGLQPASALERWYEATHWNVSTWSLDRARKQKPLHVHLALRLEILNRRSSFRIRFKSPDTLGFLCEELIRYRHEVWPDADSVAPDRRRAPVHRSGGPVSGPLLDGHIEHDGTEQPEGIMIAAWCPDEKAELPPEQVHFVFYPGHSLALPVLLRLTDSGRLDRLVKTLVRYRSWVWPEAEPVDFEARLPETDE